MTTTVLSPRGNSKPPYGSFAGKSPFVPADSKNFVRNFTVLGLGGYSRPLWGSFAGKIASVAVPVVPADVIDPSLGARGGGATRKQLKKYLQNEERFQRRKRELDRVFETMGQPKKVASLKNTADIGGPKLIIIPIDDDDDDYDIMMWAAQ